MPEPNDHVQQVLSDLANALQTAAPLATRLRQNLGETAQDAATLEAAVDRAVRAVKRVEPPATGA